MVKEKVEIVPVAHLVPYAENARVHSARQVDAIAKSLTEFGWLNPILADDNNVIIAGHGRIAAAKQLGMETAPVLRVSELTPEQVKAYRLADNRLAEMAQWDDDLLAPELDMLREADFDLTTIGFDDLVIEGSDSAPIFNPVEGPGEGEGLDHRTPVRNSDNGTSVTCPQCGFDFEFED